MGDAAAAALLAAGVPAAVRPDLAAACAGLSASVGALVVLPEVLLDPGDLLGWREREPAWSEVPVVVLGPEDLLLEAQLGGVLFTGPEGLAAAVDRARRARVRQLVRRDRDHQDALSILSHELRNPLAAIANAVYLLRHGGSTPKVLDLLDRQVKQLVRILDDVRDRTHSDP